VLVEYTLPSGVTFSSPLSFDVIPLLSDFENSTSDTFTDTFLDTAIPTTIVPSSCTDVKELSESFCSEPLQVAV